MNIYIFMLTRMNKLLKNFSKKLQQCVGILFERSKKEEEKRFCGVVRGMEKVVI